MAARVLDVGNCGPDHGMIGRMLTSHFDVRVEPVMFVPEALERLRRERFDLVLVNRLIFDDGSDGLDLVRRMQSDAELRSTPIMMISNFADAQERAVSAGAAPGFGKAEIGAPRALALLERFLPPRTTASVH